MRLRFVTKTIHAYLDYPVALSLLALPFIVGVVFLVVPFVFGFHGLDAGYYWANAIAVLLVTTVLNAPERKNRAVGPVRA
jgi:VIT1/CCC1 family predicted Fe2+/Mn2+ transporter